MTTRSPLCLRRRPKEAAVSPLPRELATPPVTKICFVTESQPIASRPKVGAWSLSQREKGDLTVLEAEFGLE